MLYEVQTLVRKERNRELLLEAEQRRLVRQLRENNQPLGYWLIDLAGALMIRLGNFLQRIAKQGNGELGEELSPLP